MIFQYQIVDIIVATLSAIEAAGVGLGYAATNNNQFSNSSMIQDQFNGQVEEVSIDFEVFAHVFWVIRIICYSLAFAVWWMDTKKDEQKPSWLIAVLVLNILGNFKNKD